MPRYLAPGLLLLRTPENSGFIPLSNDPKRQLIYNLGKISAKTVGQNKNLFESLNDILWGDAKTILEHYGHCLTEDELNKLRLSLFVQLTTATAAGGDLQTPQEIVDLLAASASAVADLAGFKARKAVIDAAVEQVKKGNFTAIPPDVLEIAKKIAEKGERPKNFSLVLRLRGPKGDQVMYKSYVNKPPSDKAIDRFKGYFGGNNSTRGNITSVNDIGRGGHQAQVELPSFNIELDQINEPGSFRKLASLIFKNKKKILWFAILGSTLYLTFKKRRALRKFVRSFKKLFKPISDMYNRVKRNKIINNPITRKFVIFTRAINRL